MTDDDAKRRILERVADGSLSPTEAAEQIAAIDNPPPPEPAADPIQLPPSGPIRTIKIRGAFRAVDVIGDPSVREAVGTGRHVARHEGETLVIDGGLDIEDDDDDDDDWFRFNRRNYRRVGIRLRSEASLQVRINPDLALDVKVDAGPLTIRNVRGPIKARVAAGPLKIDGFQSPIDLHVSAGPIKGRGHLDHGESHVQCEAGSVHLHLDDDSSVRVKAGATLGKVHLFGERDGDRVHDRDRDRDWHWEDIAGAGVSRIVGNVLGNLGNNTEATIGSGEGTLDVEVAMGAVHISAG